MSRDLDSSDSDVGYRRGEKRSLDTSETGSAIGIASKRPNLGSGMYICICDCSFLLPLHNSIVPHGLSHVSHLCPKGALPIALVISPSFSPPPPPPTPSCLSSFPLHSHHSSPCPSFPPLTPSLFPPLPLFLPSHSFLLFSFPPSSPHLVYPLTYRR